ncbi:NADP-dependent phosphogluconate dehydrogenase [Flavobacterium sp.]
MNNQKYILGMIGLGTMGRNLLLNMMDHGFAVSGYDKNEEQVSLLNTMGNENNIKGFHNISDFVHSLKSPRTIMMLVPAGNIVDAVLQDLIPLLDKGDIIIDGGNSYFMDTDRRVAELKNIGLHFFGMGISGGENGARFGPSMMPGGDKDAYDQVKYIFEKIAANVDGQPCVTYLGPGSAGHYVKMVHNGIEYALMQLIAETYQILKTGLKQDNDAIHKIFTQWNEGRLKSFLLEITKDIFAFKNADTIVFLIDDIRDEAKAKGTGKWTSQSAMDLQVSIPVIDIAVSMRDLSKYKLLRIELSKAFPNENHEINLTDTVNDYIAKLEQAFYFSMITTFAQGMHLLFKASQTYNYNLQLEQIAKIWRGGCIIRAAFLENIFQAFHNNLKMEHLLQDNDIQTLVKNNLTCTRKVITSALSQGIAVPAFAASLSYFDSIRTEQMPSNLIQAQRDFFGAHTYELIGKEGVFHTDWETRI